MTTAVLIGGKETRSLEAQLAALGYVPQIYSPHFSLVNAALVQECRTRGMKLVPWTVNELSDMQRLKDLGVDGIITDYANLFDKLK
jgi:glycerophosphoryl diester phosphodiesterase